MELKEILNEQEYKGYLKAEIYRLTALENWDALLLLVDKEFNKGDMNTLLNSNKTLSNEVPEHYKTGYKVDINGRKRYRLHYVCDECGHKGNHYIYPDTEETYCHECDNQMEVRSMQNEYKVEKDAFNNFFYAGTYYPKELI